jgi:hypothetical protein
VLEVDQNIGIEEQQVTSPSRPLFGFATDLPSVLGAIDDIRPSSKKPLSLPVVHDLVRCS